jgi:hypothetical protein
MGVPASIAQPDNEATLHHRDALAHLGVHLAPDPVPLPTVSACPAIDACRQP